MADQGVSVSMKFNPDSEVIAQKFASINLQNPTQDAINKILFRIESYGKQLAPVGTPESTHKKGYVGGRLRGSIQTSPLQGMSDIGGMVSTNVDYAIYVHEGTYKMRARPFLTAALQLVSGDMDNEIGQHLDKFLVDEFKSLSTPTVIHL